MQIVVLANINVNKKSLSKFNIQLILFDLPFKTSRLSFQQKLDLGGFLR